jgi:hypothetical protein
MRQQDKLLVCKYAKQKLTPEVKTITYNSP